MKLFPITGKQRNWKIVNVGDLTQKKKNETNPIALEPRVGGRNKYTAMEHDLSCHSVTSFSSIVSLSTSSRIFKYRRVFTLGQKMSDCKSERVNIKCLVTLKKSATETFQLLI
jgi:hypothetical protein